MAPSLDILSAALSAAVYDGPGIRIKFGDNGESVLTLHDLTRAVGRVNNADKTSKQTLANEELDSTIPDAFEILVETFSERRLKLRVKPEMTVRCVKQMIAEKEILPSKSQKLLVAGKELKDNRSLKRSDITCDSVLSLDTLQTPIIQINKGTLAPNFDYDFTNVKDDGKTYIRGGEVYRRPYGWRRYALNVKGQFEDDTWLGLDGIRTDSSKGEWPVSFHGTSKLNAESIAEVGFKLARGKRNQYGRGIYTTPDIKVAEQFATQFEFQGKTYLVVLQNRVNPASLRKVVKASSDGNGAYWLNDSESDVRPYGILIREWTQK